MQNAKEELEKTLSNKAGVRCAYINNEEIWDDHDKWIFKKTLILKEGYSGADYNAFMDSLNFEYNDGYGGQQLFGTVWLEDDTWLERCEYDGSEWWRHVKMPQIPKECLQRHQFKLKTLILENNFLPRWGMDFGWGNGYVIIPKGHPLHGVHYDDINVDVHYGLTFSELVDKPMAKRFGLETEDIGAWMVGFDTAHTGDTLQNWPKERVQQEADSLKQQLENFNKS